MPVDQFKCYFVTRDVAGKLSSRLTQRPLEELPEGDVLIRVAYSSLNYKDALAATGHPGVNKVFPHVPGVDAAGVVTESGVYELVERDRVLVTGFDMGANRWGGLAEYIRVPQGWVVPLPEGLSLRESMLLGTAGLTAGLCVDALERNEIRADSGRIVVTGASGGVGSIAVAILAKLGYDVAAVTGNSAAYSLLKDLGAQEILPREELDDRSGRPLLSRRWAGAVDTVGGNILGTILRETQFGGCVACCGMVAGADLPISVYPFILRGISLAGIDAAWVRTQRRHQTWQRLAGPWKPDGLDRIAELIELEDVAGRIEDILAGRLVGRVAVSVGGEEVIRRGD